MMHLWGVYGRELFTLDGIGDQLDLDKFAKEFFKKGATSTSDISVDGNANVASKTVIDWLFEFPKPLQRYNSYYLLWKKLKDEFDLATANELIEKQLIGDFYINDFSDIGRPYCFNFSTYDIALEGLNMSSRLKINPPKSLDSFLRQVEQFTVYAANSTLGATGLADLVLVCSVFVEQIMNNDYRDHRVEFRGATAAWEYVRERIISFIYTVNWEFRGNQSPFTNVSVYDDVFLKELLPDYSVAGKTASIKTVQLVQGIFLDCFEREMKRSPLTFPVLSSCHTVVTKEETQDVDSPYYGWKVRALKDKKFRRKIAAKNRQYGFINMFYGTTATLSSCCRLRSDKSYFNSFGAGGSKIGSLGVVTVNWPRMALRSIQEKGMEHFVLLVLQSVRDVAKINHAKRQIIRSRIEDGAMPLYDLGYMELGRQYSTYGITGLNEALAYLGIDICSESGQWFVIELLKQINALHDELQERYSAPHNCEQTPAESSAVKLPAKDELLNVFGESGPPSKVYSNQFIPLTTEADMLDRLRIQGKFDSLFSGGAICHVNVAQEIERVEDLEDLMEYAAECGVVYWAVNYHLRQCSEGHLWVNEGSCPVCGGEQEKSITRVVGFFTHVEHWNRTRREHDWPNRQFYTI